jgi:hypothetical protein
MQHIQTLGQKLVAKRPELGDYACNVFADKCAMLDIALEGLDAEKDGELIEVLKVVREQLQRRGEAIFIMHSDVLTNLGLKVGKTGTKELSGRKTHADSKGI